MSYSLEIEGLVKYKHKLEDENERMRLALTRIVDCAKSDPDGCPRCKEIALAALAKAEGQ